jgi:hypothetical protein
MTKSYKGLGALIGCGLAFIGGAIAGYWGHSALHVLTAGAVGLGTFYNMEPAAFGAVIAEESPILGIISRWLGLCFLAICSYMVAMVIAA